MSNSPSAPVVFLAGAAVSVVVSVGFLLAFAAAGESLYLALAGFFAIDSVVMMLLRQRHS